MDGVLPTQNDTNITDKLIKIQRLFNLFVTTSPEKDSEFRIIVKEEVDRLLKESLALSFNLQPIPEEETFNINEGRNISMIQPSAISTTPAENPNQSTKKRKRDEVFPADVNFDIL